MVICAKGPFSWYAEICGSRKQADFSDPASETEEISDENDEYGMEEGFQMEKFLSDGEGCQ